MAQPLISGRAHDEADLEIKTQTNVFKVVGGIKSTAASCSCTLEFDNALLERKEVNGQMNDF